MEPMHITQADVEYMQGRLQMMNEGDVPRWSIRDRAVVSRLIIILNQCAEQRIVDVDAVTMRVVEAELKLEPIRVKPIADR
jgi:hypothetical protein